MLTYWEEHILQFIVKNQDKLNFNLLSGNLNITWNIIQSNPDKNWNWCYISYNQNITWDIIQANPDKNLNWRGISINPNITCNIIYANPDKNWDWKNICFNKFTLEKKLFQENIESLNKLVIND